ncbi:Translocator protein [Halotydeus destructor]|nr:Translocator protein [Halotydeus destructor]
MLQLVQLAKIASAIVLPHSVGLTGAYFTRKEVKGEWYTNLKKAPFNPPNWVFPVAWTGLYTAMGLASFLVYESGNGFEGAARWPLTIYGAHLVLNGIWNPLFFAGKKVGLALICNLLIDYSIYACIKSFEPVNQTAAYIMYPYMAWAAFATLLTSHIWFNNSDKDTKRN